MVVGLVLMMSHFVIAVCPSISRAFYPDLRDPSAKSFMFLNTALPTLAGFSALRALKIGGPKNAWKEVGRVWEEMRAVGATTEDEGHTVCGHTARRCCMTGLKVIECLILFLVGVVALCVKIFQLKFLVEAPFESF